MGEERSETKMCQVWRKKLPLEVGKNQCIRICQVSGRITKYIDVGKFIVPEIKAFSVKTRKVFTVKRIFMHFCSGRRC